LGKPSKQRDQHWAEAKAATGERARRKKRVEGKTKHFFGNAARLNGDWWSVVVRLIRKILFLWGPFQDRRGVTWSSEARRRENHGCAAIEG